MNNGRLSHYSQLDHLPPISLLQIVTHVDPGRQAHGTSIRTLSFKADTPFLKSIPLTRHRHLTLPSIPFILLLLGLLFFLRNLLPSSRMSGHTPNHRTSSPFLVDQSLFLPPPPPPSRPVYLPEPLLPKKKGMLVPDSLHYVYGLKPVPEGELGEELPYYAYLAVRSAILNLRPAKIYLSVAQFV